MNQKLLPSDAKRLFYNTVNKAYPDDPQRAQELYNELVAIWLEPRRETLYDILVEVYYDQPQPVGVPAAKGLPASLQTRESCERYLTLRETWRRVCEDQKQKQGLRLV